MGVVHVEPWAGRAVTAVLLRAAFVSPVQSDWMVSIGRLFRLARERFVYASNSSPRGVQRCFKKLLRSTFRKGVGLGVEDQVVASHGSQSRVARNAESGLLVPRTQPSRC
jgi:hypothetical protein